MPARLNASININAASDNTVIAAITGVTLKIYDLCLINSVATAQTATVKDAAGGNTLAVIPLPSAVGGMVQVNNDVNPQWLTATGGAFTIALSAATAVNGFVQYEAG